MRNLLRHTDALAQIRVRVNRLADVHRIRLINSLACGYKPRLPIGLGVMPCSFGDHVHTSNIQLQSRFYFDDSHSRSPEPIALLRG